MKDTPMAVAWLVFLVGNLASWIVGQLFWRSPGSQIALAALGGISVVVGATIVIRQRFKLGGLVMIVLGIVLGQWWWIETRLLQLGWSLGGFAP